MCRVLLALCALGLFGVLLSGVFSTASAEPQLASPPPVEAYGNLPAVEMVSLSPSGDHYAFIAKSGDRRRILVAGRDNKPILAADVGTTKVLDLGWAGDDYILIRRSATVNLGLEFTVMRAELYGVIVLNVKTGKLLSVFDKHGDQVANAVFGEYGTAKIDGQWYGYFGGVTYEKTLSGSYMNQTYPDLYRVDLETGALHVVARGQEDLNGWQMGDDGQPLARTLYNEKTGVWSVSALAGGSRLLAQGKSGLEEPVIMGRSRTAGALLLARPTENGAFDYQELPLDGSPAKQVADSDTLRVAVIDPISQTWIGQIGEGDDQPLTLFNPAVQARWRGAQKAFPGYLVRLISWSQDFNRMIVFTEGGDDSGTYWLVDIPTGAATVFGAAYPDVQPRDVGPVRMVDYTAADGMALHGVLTLPPGRNARNLPLIVLPHGGPQERDYLGFDWWAQAFASRGYAVFQPNFRGSGGYGAKYRNAGFGEWGRKMQTDISDGVAELSRQGIVDPKRACIVGGSYGGYAALAGVTVQQGFYRCAVAVAGVSDLAAMLDYENQTAGSRSSTTRYWRTFMGVTSFWQTELNSLSPIKLAARADAPILLIHGKDDTTVLVSQSQTMERALKAAGKPVTLVTLPGEDHHLSREETRIAMLKAAVDFVEKYDPPDARAP